MDLTKHSDDTLIHLGKIEEGASEPDYRYHDEYYRRVLTQEGMQAYKKSGLAGRWVLLFGTTNSGKLQWRCRMCNRFSVAPDKRCAAGCHEREK